MNVWVCVLLQVTGITMKIEGYSIYISFILLASKKIIDKLFGNTILNMYLCARFSTMKSKITLTKK